MKTVRLRSLGVRVGVSDDAMSKLVESGRRTERGRRESNSVSSPTFRRRSSAER